MVLGAILGFTMRTGYRVGRVEEKVDNTSLKVESLSSEIGKKADTREINKKFDYIISRIDTLFELFIDDKKSP